MLLLLSICSATVWAESVVVLPDDAHIQYVGRFTADKTFGWTGSNIRCRFVGTSITAKLTTKSKKIALQVIVDGEPTHVIFVTPNESTYNLAQNLSPGEHQVELFQRTEAYFGQTTFNGFELSEGAKLLPIPQAKRKLMVLGDSITCAYGSEESDRSKGNTAENENGYMSYAAITARQVDADIMMICWSGRGMYRNRGINDVPGQGTIPVLFDRVLPLNDKQTWEMASYVPDVVIINLGTNDLYRGKDQKPELTKENFVGAYRKTVDRLKAAYPKVQIFACIGPMAQQPISDWLADLASEDDAIHAVTFPGYNGVNEDIGGHWHPANSKMQKMADQLTGEIKSIMKW
tara:strand:- start:1228 stop:2268 length:1041 start_codon:yes stop_codon:yes gene_type:complete